MTSRRRGGVGVVVLGATGSVGSAAADVLLEHPDRFHVRGLAAGRKGDRLLDLGRRLKAETIVLVDEEAGRALRPSLKPGDPDLRFGQAALLDLVADSRTDVVLQG
ncbi:MAG: 1-deoxy-D-xylulose-5-phosphate reductoisomerase, partial [Elusimicrobia bacterium]